MRRGVLAALVVLSVGTGCSSSGSGNSGPAKAQVDQTALLFGLVTGSGVPVGTQPSNSVQVFNSGSGTITVSGDSVGMGPTSITQTLPLGPGGASEMYTLATDPSHPEFFTASTPSASSVSGTSASVIQVIFAPTIPGAFSASLNITTSAGSLTVTLAGDAVAPLVSTADGGLSFTVPQITLTPSEGNDGGPTYLADGGPAYTTGYSSTIIPLYNIGSEELTFMPATLDVNGSGNFLLCRPLTGATGPCNPGPTPLSVGPAYSDGGLAVGPDIDGGTSLLSADLKVYFSTAVPGTYTQTITVLSNATNTPMLTLSVSGTAVPPP